MRAARSALARASCPTVPSARTTRSVAIARRPGVGGEAPSRSLAGDRLGEFRPVSDAIAIVADTASESAIPPRIATLRNRGRPLREEVIAPGGDRHSKRSDVRAPASSLAGEGGSPPVWVATASVEPLCTREPRPWDGTSRAPREAVTATWLSVAVVRRCPRSSLRRRRTSGFGDGETLVWRHSRASGTCCCTDSGRRSVARARPVIWPVSRSVSYHSSVAIAPPSASCANRLRTEPLADRSAGPVCFPVPVPLLIADSNTLASMMSDNVKPALGP